MAWHGWQWFKENPDSQIPEFSTKLGMYKENCGLDNVVMSWGHDEYMFQVHIIHPSIPLNCVSLCVCHWDDPSARFLHLISLFTPPFIIPYGYINFHGLMLQVMKHNNTTLPPQALFVIRYHSFYGETNS
jgi:hypothetical protein